MGRKIGLAVLLLVAGLLVCAVLLRREPPQMPPDRDHLPAVEALAVTGPDRACLSCHGPSGRKPRSEKHPLANDCARCHSLRPAPAR